MGGELSKRWDRRGLWKRLLRRRGVLDVATG